MVEQRPLQNSLLTATALALRITSDKCHATRNFAKYSRNSVGRQPGLAARTPLQNSLQTEATPALRITSDRCHATRNYLEFTGRPPAPVQPSGRHPRDAKVTIAASHRRCMSRLPKQFLPIGVCLPAQEVLHVCSVLVGRLDRKRPSP